MSGIDQLLKCIQFYIIMKIYIEDLKVIFPYSLVFNEQEVYMKHIKHALDQSGHALLEMPTGTGKTICLLALLTAYLSQRTKYKRLIYCTRTVGEMEKTLIELKKLLKKRKEEQKDGKKFLCLGLTAKKNLCVHNDVKQWRQSERVETECKKRTAEWVKHSSFNSQSGEHPKCQFYENMSKKRVIERIDDHQVFTMEDLKIFGKQQVLCPYFTARETIKEADIIVFNYLYLLDPQISSDFIKKLAKSKDTIVVFDEAHNIDDVCIEAYTLKVNNLALTGATRNVRELQQKIDVVTEESKDRYKKQLGSLIREMKEKQLPQINNNEMLKNNFQKISNIHNQDRFINTFIPETLSNRRMFLSSLQLVLQFLKNKLKENNVRFYDNVQLRKEMEINTNLDSQFFKLSNQTLSSLVNSLQITEVEELKSLQLVTFFCELVFSYSSGFKIVFQPHPMDGNIADPLLTLSCLDCSLCLKPIWKHFPSVILTSGTMSPIHLYPKMLGFQPVVCKSINIQIGRNPINPMILGRTYDQETLSSQYTLRSQEKVSLAFGNLLRGLSEIVPDGILCFFPSYMYMEHILKQWKNLGIIDKLIQSRYVFMEKKDPNETAQSLIQYRKACDVGRGAIFLAIARGKIAEGVDFQEHYGRCVIMMGFPVQNSHDPVLLERIKFMVEHKQIKDRNEFFEFDTMRQTAQCLGRVMRKKTDYGIMILADNRFTKAGKYEKLPEWIKKCLDQQNINVTYEAVFHICSDFFRKMGKTFKLNQSHFKMEQDFLSNQKLYEDRQQLEKENLNAANNKSIEAESIQKQVHQMNLESNS